MRALVLALAAVLVLAACGGAGTNGVRDEGPAAIGGDAEVSPAAAAGEDTAPVVPAVPAPGTAFVYMLRFDQPVPVRRSVPISLPVSEGSLRALVGGPTQAELVLDYSTAIPEGTRVLAYSVDKRTATVDLSAMPEVDGASEGDALLALYQVVYTVTGAAGVDAVRVRVAGRPYGLNSLTGGSSAGEPALTRAALSFVVDAATVPGSAGCAVAKKGAKPFKGDPYIAIARPEDGGRVTGTIEVRGTVQGLDGPLVLRLVQDQLEVANRIIDEKCRGAFSATIPVPRGLVGDVELVVVAPAADGEPAATATRTFTVTG